MYFLTPRRNRVSVFAAFKQAISETALVITSVAAEFRSPAPAPADPAPIGLYEPDEMPPAEDIAAAAREFDRAADQARRADRGKRAARKILDRLPAGTYGGWLVERIASNRQTADLQEIARIFKAHGLGPVPMRQSAPSLKVKAVPAVEVPAEFQVLAGVAA